MTNIITRYFDSADQARLVRHEFLYRRRFSQKIVHLFETSDGLADALAEYHVDAKTAKAYQDKVAKSGAVLLVQAGYKPLAVAKTTREVTAEMGAADMGALVEEVLVDDPIPTPNPSVLTDHPHMLFRPRDPYATNHHMADWPIPLISRRVPYSDALFPKHSHMANAILPLLSQRKPYTGSIISRHGRMANFPIGLISKRKPFTGSIFGRHARMANFPIGLISNRKPFTGSIFPRHQRMATVPFPLLINGETGKNALIPGSPRMANFPISLISKRKPFTGSIFSRHARMANFPISLISKRKPFTGSIIPRHGRMANFILPLVIKHGERTPQPERAGFSLSKMLGMPTIARR